MRTTLNIDDDILEAARDLGAREHKSVDEVISDWARRGLELRGYSRNGVPVLPSRRDLILPDRIGRIMDEESI